MTSKKRRLLITASTLLIGLLLAGGAIFLTRPAQAKPAADWQDPPVVLIDSDFDDDTASWPWVTSETFPGHATSEVKDADGDGDNELCVTIETLGINKYDIQLKYRRLKIVDGHNYSAHFDAWTVSNATGTALYAKVASSHVPYDNEYFSKWYKIPTTSQGFDFTFTGKQFKDLFTGKMMDDTAVEMSFHLGDSDDNQEGAVFCFDNISLKDETGGEIPSVPQEPALSFLRYNRYGYLENGPQVAAMAGAASDMPHDIAWGIQSVDGRTGETRDVCSTGTCGWAPLQAGGIDRDSGQSIWSFDFSFMHLPAGTYRLYYIDPFTTDHVYGEDFAIYDGLYGRTLSESLRYFYLNRSGIELTSEYAWTWARGAGHLDVSSDGFIPSKVKTYYKVDPEKPETAITFDNSVPCFTGGDIPGNPDKVNDNVKYWVTDKTAWQNCTMVRDENGNPTNNDLLFPNEYRVDGSGGWYDAGDHGKYVVNGGIAVWTLLNLYESNPEAFTGDNLASADNWGIPESNNGIPDILDEAKWELDFMMRMQVPQDSGEASGMVHHMLHDTMWTDIPLRPDDWPQYMATQHFIRAVYPPTIAATLNLAAVGAQCERIFQQFDPYFASRCNAASHYAWVAAWEHRDADPKDLTWYSTLTEDGMIRFNGGGPYDDTDMSDEFAWAAAERYIVSADEGYLQIMQDMEHYLEVPTTLGSAGSGSMDWKNTAALGTLSLAVTPKTVRDDVRQAAQDNIIAAARSYLMDEATQGFRLPYKPGLNPDTGEYEYAWGSNSFVLNNMIIMSLAHRFAPDEFEKADLLNGVVKGMNYLMGYNAMGVSYASQPSNAANLPTTATNYLNNPHHRTWGWQAWPRWDERYSVPPPMAISGGPNSQKDALTNPLTGNKATIAMDLWNKCHYSPQTCYIDDSDAFAVNEVTINWNAPFVWVLNYLDANRVQPTLPAPSYCQVQYEPQAGGTFDDTTIKVTITNLTDQTLTGWNLKWAMPLYQYVVEPPQQVTLDVQNLMATAQGTGDGIPKHESRSFQFHLGGFNDKLPVEFKLNDNVCQFTPPTSQRLMEISYSIRDQQPNSFAADVTLTNHSNVTVDGWTVELNFPGSQQITQATNAGFSQQGNQAVLWNTEAGNKTIPPGGSAAFSFNATYTGRNDPVTDYTASPTSILPPSTSGLTASYSIRALQPNSFSADVTIVNNSNVTVNGWTVKWTFPGNQQITQVWNAGYSQNGNQVTMWDTQNWNKDIAPGGTASGFGFNVSYSGSNAMPTDFQVIPDNASPPPGPTPTPVPNPGLPVKVVVNNDWGSGYCAVVTVTNNTGSPVDWLVSFDIQGKIYTFWNAIWTQAGNKVTIGGVDWNNILKVGESTRDVGFCANK